MKSSIPFTKLITEVLEAFNFKNQTTLKGAQKLKFYVGTRYRYK